MAVKRSGRDETHDAVSRSIANGDFLRLVLTPDGRFRADVQEVVAAAGPDAPREQPPDPPSPDDPQNV